MCILALAPAANALVIDLNTGGLLPPVQVKVLEPDPTPAVVDADVNGDAVNVEALTFAAPPADNDNDHGNQGGSAVVNAVVNLDGTVTLSSTKGLSRVT